MVVYQDWSLFHKNTVLLNFPACETEDSLYVKLGGGEPLFQKNIKSEKKISILFAADGHSRD